MNQITLIFPLILKLLPNLIIIREISKLGRSLNLGLTFFFLILICKFPELIRSFSQLLGILLRSGEYSEIYLNFFYAYQISYVIGVIFTFFIVNKLFPFQIPNSMMSPFTFFVFCKISDSFKNL